MSKIQTLLRAATIILLSQHMSVSQVALAADKAPPDGCNCQAAEKNTEPTKKKHKHPILSLAKGLGKELGTSAEDMGKDMILVFSVQDIDPYEKKGPPDNKPYVLGEVRYIDGSSARIFKFPDKSLRISGGFADGTYACPIGENVLKVNYPNGATGTLTLLPGGGCKVQRPDNTVTTIAKQGDGTFRMSNDKLGYMGDINSDPTGLSYEFAQPKP